MSTPDAKTMDDVQSILRAGAALVELGATVIAAITSADDPKRVQDVLPATLLTTLARLNAELEAQKKFAPQG
jgi:hypothetical protein